MIDIKENRFTAHENRATHEIKAAQIAYIKALKFVDWELDENLDLRGWVNCFDLKIEENDDYFGWEIRKKQGYTYDFATVKAGKAADLETAKKEVILVAIALKAP